MPNWTSNNLTVTGKPADLKKFIKAVKSKERAFDFENIVPMPKELCGITTGSCIINGVKCDMWRDMGPSGAPEPIDKEEMAVIKKATGGHGSWYDWSCANWGTKWNASDVAGPDAGSGSVTYRFDTAWCAPMPLLVAASKMFPSLTLSVHCEHEGDSRWDEFSIKKGVVTDGDTGEVEMDEEEDEP